MWYSLLLKLDYEEVCNKLKEKYWEVPGYYFWNEELNSEQPKIKRWFHGLYLHHLDEDTVINLSIKKQPQRKSLYFSKIRQISILQFIRTFSSTYKNIWIS